MKRKIYKNKSLVPVLLVCTMVFNSSVQLFGQIYPLGSWVGTTADSYIINQDYSQHASHLRFQSGNNFAWNLYQSGSNDGFSISFTNTTDWEDLGDTYFTIRTNGNIGINTKAPVEKLDVFGNIRSMGKLYSNGLYSSIGMYYTAPWDHIFMNHDGAIANIWAGGAENGLSIKVGSVQSGEFSANNANYNEAMRILPNGNVGLGTAAPTEKLDVVGNAKVSGSFTTTGTLSGGSLNITTGKVGIGVQTPTERFEVVGNSKISGSLSASTISASSSITTGGFITASSLSVSTGNVAIGLVTPTEKLTVGGKIKALDQIRAEGAGSSIGMIAGATWDHIFMNHDGAIANIWAGGAEKGLSIKVGSVQSGVFSATASNYTEAMRILPGGNVGLGTAAPTEKLEVVGNIQIDATGGFTSGPLSAIRFYDPTGNANPAVIYYSTNNQISSINLMAGRVGINNLAPTEAFEVNGNAKVSGSLTANSLVVPSFSTTGALSGSSLNITTGKVGIGVQAPTEKLEVIGNTKVSGSVKAASLYTSNVVSGSQGRGWNLKGGSATSGTSTQNTLLFNFDNNGTEQTQMAFHGESGMVGIGTAPSKGILHIKGSFHVENSSDEQVFHVSAGKQLVFVGASAYDKYIATLDSASSEIQADDYSLWVSKGVVGEDFAIASVEDWDDYVFNDEYKLASLKDVETYIKQNKHLPNIPSAVEVKHGYTLHKMNRGFLKTLEELTLYSIEQNKKIESLQQQLEKLKELTQEVAMLKEKLREK